MGPDGPSPKAHLESSRTPTSAPAEAFGRAFGALMKRRSARAVDGRDGGGDADRALELEVLIRDHGVEPTVAEYVRHVVREGFEAAFDSMDPA